MKGGASEGQIQRAGDSYLKQARKFAKFINRKYKSRDLAFPTLVKKARKYKKSYNLSDSVFHTAMKIYEQRYMTPSRSVHLEVRGSSEIGRQLGVPSGPAYDKPAAGLDVSGDDKKYVQAIMDIAKSNTQLHSHAVLQSFTYTDCADNVLYSTFNSNIHNPGCAVNPVLAALFVPKIQAVDDRFVNSNLAQIIERRYRNMPIIYRQDHEFYFDITTDSNDLVCDQRSIYKDLLNRVNVQESIRRIVWNIRNGILFECDNNDFINLINDCSISFYDAPHLLFMRDEGTILRRLLNIFSFRPTYVTTRPLVGNLGQSVVNPFPDIRPMSMIEVRLPVSGTAVGAPVVLENAIETPQWYVENKFVVAKMQTIVYSRDVLFFYVNRRIHSIEIFKEYYYYSRMPRKMLGSEKANTYPVDVRQVISINDETYFLRSVVCLKVDGNGTIIGANTHLVKYDADFTNNQLMVYDGIESSQVSTSAVHGIRRQAPITNYTAVGPDGVEQWENSVRELGTIFVYARGN